MRSVARTSCIACLVLLTAALGASPALGEPVFELGLNPAAESPAPLTHSDERLAYQVNIKNGAGTNPEVGAVLTCKGTPVDGLSWFGTPAPQIEVEWLRDGEPIPGTKAPASANPNGNTYTVAPADIDKALQCAVRGTNEAENASGTGDLTENSTVVTDVATARGTGTLSPGSNTISGLNTSSGSFRKGQYLRGPGIPESASGTGDVSAFEGFAQVTGGSNVLTNVNTEHAEVGQVIQFLAFYFSPGTTITAVGANTLTLSANALNSHPNLGIVALSKTVSDLKTTTGSFVVGHLITGEGIQPGTTVTAVGPNSLELSQYASESGDDVELAGSTLVTSVGPDSLTFSATATEAGQKELLAGPQPFAPGQSVSGPGIPPGTSVVATSAQTLTLSNPASASSPDAVLAGTFNTFGSKWVSQPTVVAPATSSPPPSQRPDTGGGEAIPGNTMTCVVPASMQGAGLSLSFQWLRNGLPIAGATSSSYVIQKGDSFPPSILQCQLTVENEAGAKALSSSPIVTTKPTPSLPWLWPAAFVDPTITFSSQAEGPVDVQMQLPPKTQAIRVFGDGWTCSKEPPTPLAAATAQCSRTGTLAPGGSYPVINLTAQVFADAADSLTTKVTASGGGTLAPVSAEDTVSGIEPAVPFGFSDFSTAVLDQEGNDFTQAGGHPFSAGAIVAFNEHVRAERSAEAGFRAANGFVREVRTELPPGFVGDPQALGEKCLSPADVVAKPTNCPAASAVGGITLETESGTFEDQPVFALEPERGTPAQFAFGVAALSPGFAYTLTPELRPGDGYAITLVAAPVQKTPELFGVDVKLCNRGAKLRFDPSLGESKFDRCWKAGDAQATPKPFLSLPTRCGDPASTLTKISADSWEAPGKFDSAQFSAPPITGCNALEFGATLKARPTTNAADSPTGLEVDINMPQSEDPEGTATAQLKKAVVTLPEGLVVNPSGANGLDACAPAQIGLGTNDPVSCPSASKIGTVQVTTPILDHPLPGTLYVAQPHDNPFGTLLALYLVVESPDDGLLIKLPGRVDPNPATGQLTSTFDQNPQAPVEDVQLKIRGGAAAPLRTPASCGKYSTTSSLTPWSAPESGPPVTPKDSWSISKGPGGGACAAAPANAPAFEAGTTSPLAGSYSPFVVKLRREDGSQQFSAVSVTPPPGLLGKLAGIPYCPDGAVAAAAVKTGREEQASPSCPAASRVGTVVAGAGAGPAPYYATGTAYLTGPYKGAPLSLAIITPAVAGPFDLGNVVVKTALRVDPETARITAISDPLPTILQGIPLDIRSVAISMDRPGFTLNPTSCDPLAVTGSLTSTLNQVAPLSNRFQVGECTRLGFKPSLRIDLKGKTQRGGNPALTATLKYPSGAYANIASASVALPHSEFLEQGHIRTVCTRVQFAANACPAGAIYGKATAISPLLDQPLSGPVYLRSNPEHELPDLVADLRGQIEVTLVGRIDSVRGGIRTTFDSVPDAPVSKFTLQMQGGSKGLLVNSRDICKSTSRALASFVGQNGKAKELKPVLKAQCGKRSAPVKPKHRP